MYILIKSTTDNVFGIALFRTEDWDEMVKVVLDNPESYFPFTVFPGTDDEKTYNSWDEYAATLSIITVTEED